MLVDTKEEGGTDQEPLERILDPVVEASALPATHVEELKQRLNLVPGGRAAIPAAGHPGEDLGRAHLLFRAARRVADEDLPAAGRVQLLSAGRDLVGACDVDGPQELIAHVALVVVDSPSPEGHLRQGLRRPLLPDERDADDVGARLDMEARSHVRDGVVHVGFPLGIAEAGGSPGETAGGRGMAGGASDRGTPNEFAVNAELEGLRPPEPDDVVHVLAPEVYAERILAVDGEVVGDGETAAGAERQVLAHPAVLLHVPVDLDRPALGGPGRQPHRQARDHAGH